MAKKTVAVIGGGLAGLASACTLAARGYEVSLFEANSWLGGKARQLNDDGFRFDMGPTILTMPDVLRRVFNEAGEKMEDYLDLIKLDPQWRCFYEDESVLDLWQEPAVMAEKLSSFASPKVAVQYEKFIEESKKLHDISERFFFWRSVESVKDTFDVGTTFKISTLRDVSRLRLGQSVASMIRKSVSDKRVTQMLDHFTQYVGSSPYGSPAVLCGIAHMQTAEGVWYPRGGTRAVPEALIRLGRKLGVNYHTSTEIQNIRVQNGRVIAVVTDSGQAIPASLVVSNMDAVRTYKELIGGEYWDQVEKKREYEPACSGVVLYLGLKKRYERLLHHNFVFSKDPVREFDDIYKKGIPAADPTCYLAAPSRTEPGVAPDGGEALYVLVHAPYIRDGQNWKMMMHDYRQVIIDKLKRTAGLTDIEDRIVYEKHLTPQDIHDRYRVLNGAIYGLASHGKYWGAFKPGNRSREVGGLYLAGGAAHPGPGMPMVLMSGWIAANSLDQDENLSGRPVAA